MNKPGSKWKTMLEQMFQYRAASFFGRIYAPDILKGMHSIDEVRDMVRPTATEDYSDQLSQIKEMLAEQEFNLNAHQIKNVNRVIDNEETESYQKVIDLLNANIKPTE
jgi:hypothetical protein